MAVFLPFSETIPITPIFTAQHGLQMAICHPKPVFFLHSPGFSLPPWFEVV
ncbi:hypothetical protein BGS_0532 [Beggiatoa sp. SS]|nr:hypothetical protein BGS_0532 [Beggiatoa sp. SS]